MATKTKEEVNELEFEGLESLDNVTGVEPRYPRRYEPVISVVIVVCALLILGFAILESGFLS